MTIAIGRALEAHLSLPTQTTCTIWLCVQASGTVLAFTDLDQSFAYNLESAVDYLGITIPELVGTGAQTYQAKTGYSRTDISTGSDLSLDNMELDGVIESPSITEADLHAGLWDYAFVCVALINWADIFQPLAVSSLTAVSTLATLTLVNAPPTPFAIGDNMLIAGAGNSDYNGVFAIHSTSAPTIFTYQMGAAPPSPATGLIQVYTVMGVLVLRAGHIGEVTLERNTFKATQSGRTQAYSRVIGELTQPGCRAELGDSRCKVPLSPPTWGPTTAYAAIAPYDASVGSTVSPVSFNDRNFICTTGGTSGGTEPSWNLTIGGTTADGSVVWTTIYARTVTGTITGVNANTITLYDTARTEPGPGAGIAITNITNGNPGIVFCNTATFFNFEAVTISGVLGPALLNANTIIQAKAPTNFSLGIDTSNTGIYPPYISGGTVTPLGGDSGYFDFGLLTFTSGLNTGISKEVLSYVPGQITLELPFPYAVSPGDAYMMTVGCDKSFTTCQTKFMNPLNFRGEPYLPGLDMIVQVGKQGG